LRRTSTTRPRPSWPGRSPASRRALELIKLALRSQRPAATAFDVAAQALLFDTQDKYGRMTAFLERKRG